MRSLVLLSSVLLLSMLSAPESQQNLVAAYKARRSTAAEMDDEDLPTPESAAEEAHTTSGGNENPEAQYAMLEESDMQTLLQERGLPKHQIPSDRQELVDLLLQTDNMERGAASAGKGASSITGEVLFRICSGWGYGKTFEQYAGALKRHFPGLDFKAETMPPTPINQLIGQVASFVFLGGMAAALFGANVIPEPYGQMISEKRTMVIGIALFANMIANQCLQTGAFEVSYNGKNIYSKLETNQLPQLPLLADLLVKNA